MKTRLTTEELAKAHGGLCGITLGAGPCSCLVHWVEALQKEADDANLQIKDLQVELEHWKGCLLVSEKHFVKETDTARQERDDAKLQLSEARKLVQGHRDHSLDYGKRSEKGSREEYTGACQLMIFDEILERWPKHTTNERCTCPDTKLHGGEKALCPWCKSQRATRKASKPCAACKDIPTGLGPYEGCSHCGRLVTR